MFEADGSTLNPKPQTLKPQSPKAPLSPEPKNCEPWSDTLMTRKVHLRGLWKQIFAEAATGYHY